MDGKTHLCLLLFEKFQEMEEELEEEYRRRTRRRRRRLWCSYLCRTGRKILHYCRLDVSVPVLARYFEGCETKPDFRLGRPAIAALLQLLHMDRQHGWGPTLEVLVLLFWLACGSSYRVVSRAFNIPLATVHRVVHHVVEKMMTCLPSVIRFPSTDTEIVAVGCGFAGLAQHCAFTHAAGAIDGCHVHIKSPAGPDGHCYNNRKLFASVVLQAVCDHQGRFIDIFVGYPGSVHDARIFKNSPLYTRPIYPPEGYFLLADGGYPCLEKPVALMTPYKRPVRGIAEQRYNSHHARGRSIIEHAFGMMKTRFRCIFLQTIEVHHTFVPKVVAACAMLHNICVGAGDLVAPAEESQDEGEEVESEVACGAAWRQRQTAEVSALEQAPHDHDYFHQEN